MKLITQESITEKIGELRRIEHAIAEGVIKYCKQQVDLWRQIPHLSLMATRRNKNDGFGGETYEYEHCLKILGGSPDNMAIDLLTGDIVYYGHVNDLIVVDWLDVLNFLKKNTLSLVGFDAREVIKQLNEEIKKTPDSNMQWREKKFKELKIKVISTQRHSMPKFSTTW